MGLREATFLVVILGTTAIAAADKPAKRDPAKKPEPTKPQPAAAANAEKPDPAAADAANDAADPDDPADATPVPPHVVGPKTVDLGNSTVIDLPEGMVMLERVEAQKLLRDQGEPAEGVVAMVVKPGSDWRVFIEYEDSGYVDDSDASDLDADELLESYRETTAEQNKTRKALGQAELIIDSWTERPRYERAPHHLVWGLAAHFTGGKVVNFFTRILGRNGYASIDLIADPDKIEAAKTEALAILQATHFKPGAAYADHVSSDRSSGVGLRGLVLGGAGVAVASKLGLFAKLLLVFKKVFIFLFAALAALFRKVFRRKREPDAGTLDPSSVPMAPPPTAPPPMGPTSMGGPGDPHDGSSR